MRHSRQSGMMKSRDQHIIIRPALETQASLQKELWEYRQVLWAMVLRNVKLQFESTYLRYLWGIAQPLLVTFGFVFIRHATNSDPTVKIDYTLYIFSGLILWNYFISTSTGAATALKREAGLLKKVYFPRIMVAAVHPFQNLVNLSLGLLVVIGMTVYFGESLSWNLALLPLVVFQVGAMSFGLGCVWSSIGLLVEDFNQVFNLVLYVGLFLSPVLFAPTNKSEFMNAVILINPMTGSLMAFRSCWFDSIPFPTEQFLYSCICTIVLFWLGVRSFRRLEILLVDRI